jgi:hypothetical protein
MPTYQLKPTRGKRRRLFAAMMTLLIMAGLYVGFRQYECRQMIRIRCEWARLDPFPASAQQFSITTEGGMFTRGIRARFATPQRDIDRWLASSPGPRSAAVESHACKRKYIIEPGGGADYAEVIVDECLHVVNIYAYWS